ncbi:MAG: hypothetical protein ACRCXD_15785 [Luteolibacter sp.]
MKHYFQIAMLGAFSTLQIFALSIPEPEQLKVLPADKVWDLYLNSIEYPRIREKILNSIFENERVDIVMPYFREYYDDSFFLGEIVALPHSGYKNRIVLVMLRMDSGFWRYEGPLYDGSRGTVSVNAVEPFVGVIRRYLPDIIIDEKLFSTKAGRLKLAADLETAMAKSEPGFKIEQSLLPQEDFKPYPPLDLLTRSYNAAKEASRDSKPLPKAKPSRMPLIVAAGALLALLLLWLLFKYRHSDSK